MQFSESEKPVEAVKHDLTCTGTGKTKHDLAECQKFVSKCKQTILHARDDRT